MTNHVKGIPTFLLTTHKGKVEGKRKEKAEWTEWSCTFGAFYVNGYMAWTRNLKNQSFLHYLWAQVMEVKGVGWGELYEVGGIHAHIKYNS